MQPLGLARESQNTTSIAFKVRWLTPDYAARRRSKRSKIDKHRSGLADPLRSDSEIEGDLNLENFDLYRSTQESIDLYRSTQIFINLHRSAHL